MKVLMLSKACVVGAYQRKLEELAALPGVDLLVVVPPYWQEEARQIKLERLYTRGYRLEEEPVRFNGRFHLFHFPGLARQIRAFRPELVHVDEEPYNLVSWHALRLARRWGARSLFFTWQNLDRGYPPPFRWFEQYCYRTVDGAIAGNEEAAQVLRRKGFARRVDVIPQFGVDPEFFKPSQHSALSTQHPFRIGFVGRLVEQKGILDLLEAMARGAADSRLVLVGAGPLQSVIEARAKAVGLASRLEIIAGVPSRQMPEIMGSLDVLVLPSRTRPNWKEQFGRALVEAMACRVPVVGSDSGEIPGVIGDAGLVFPEGDVEVLAAHLETLRASAELRRDLGERGRNRVLANFTQARIAQQTHEVYQRILQHGR